MKPTGSRAAAFSRPTAFCWTPSSQLVCNDDDQPRSGTLAWDLFAGVGLFSRVLARSFHEITAVEANPTAVADLRAALTKRGTTSTVHESTTLDFLRRAVLDRDRPELIVLDPPRAGVGLEACELLVQIAAPQLVYVSCDPTTLARDLSALQPLLPHPRSAPRGPLPPDLPPRNSRHPRAPKLDTAPGTFYPQLTNHCS